MPPTTKYYDITVPIAHRMLTWPSDPPVRFTQFKSIRKGDHSNVLHISLGTHSGSHVDSPAHFGGRRTVDQLPLDSLIGPAVVVHVKSRDLIRPSDLKGVDLARAQRILFRTRNSRGIGDGIFHEDYVALSSEVVELLRPHRPKLIGIDAMSADTPGGSAPAHHRLLLAGTILLETINLLRVPAGAYQLICLPLKLTGSDGAPARVILVKSAK